MNFHRPDDRKLLAITQRGEFWAAIIAVCASSGQTASARLLVGRPDWWWPSRWCPYTPAQPHRPEAGTAGMVSMLQSMASQRLNPAERGRHDGRRHRRQSPGLSHFLRSRRTVSPSSPRGSPSGRESAHFPLHLSRKDRQSNPVVSLMRPALPPATGCGSRGPPRARCRPVPTALGGPPSTPASLLGCDGSGTADARWWAHPRAGGRHFEFHGIGVLRASSGGYP